jgi:SAM-dependent methyltransferase
VTAIAQLADKLAASLADDTFVRLVLSSPVGGDVEKVIGRLVVLKTGPHLSLTYRYATRDVVKNIPVADVPVWLPEQLPGKFRSALLGTTKRDWQLHDDRLVSHKPATTAPPARAHDQARPSVLDESARAWLPADADKRRQIDRYAEIFSHLAKECAWPECPTIADMGCGKGYLTFAVWHLMRGRSAKIIGVEQRPELVANANQLAKQIGATGLEFVTGTIATVTLPALDGLIALHACDTATDDAIRRGVAAQAKLIIVAPCCHQAVRPQLGRPEPLAPVLAHGLMAERMAEWATDGLRALALEAAGYRVKMIEFIASEHTPKNLMIAAIRTGQPTGNERLEAFRQFFGIQHHALLECGGLTPPSPALQGCVKSQHSK